MCPNRLFCAILVGLLAPSYLLAAAPAGLWLGTLDAGVTKLRLGLEVVDNGAAGAAVALISIDQGGERIPAAEPMLGENEVSLAFPAVGGKFSGKLAADGQSLTGTWSQGGAELPLTLEKVDQLPTHRRPQAPQPPFPYQVEEVAFTNPAGGHTLAGTLTLPNGEGRRPAVVMISGSGPQDRDETIVGHKPFWVIADALSRRGVAVLRYDDRGVGGSQGDFAAATPQDLTADALAAVRFLAGRDGIDPNRIAVCGHSEGAMLAAMLAADNPEVIHAAILLAPPAVPGKEVIVTQGRVMETKVGAPAATVDALAELRRQAIDSALSAETDEQFQAELRDAVDAYLESAGDSIASDAARDALTTALAAYRTPWFRSFLAYDPSEALRRVRCPVLAIIGGRDVQVVPEANLPPLREALAAAPTKDVTIENPPELNHLLQTAETGLPTEYSVIEETIAPSALQLITDWATARLDAE